MGVLARPVRPVRVNRLGAAMSALDLRTVERLLSRLRMAFEDGEAAGARVLAIAAELEPLVGVGVARALVEIGIESPSACPDCSVVCRPVDLTTSGRCTDCVRAAQRKEFLL